LSDFTIDTSRNLRKVGQAERAERWIIAAEIHPFAAASDRANSPNTEIRQVFKRKQQKRNKGIHTLALTGGEDEGKEEVESEEGELGSGSGASDVEEEGEVWEEGSSEQLGGAFCRHHGLRKRSRSRRSSSGRIHIQDAGSPGVDQEEEEEIAVARRADQR
jgi:hypothetical protein